MQIKYSTQKTQKLISEEGKKLSVIPTFYKRRVKDLISDPDLPNDNLFQKIRILFMVLAAFPFPIKHAIIEGEDNFLW